MSMIKMLALAHQWLNCPNGECAVPSLNKNNDDNNNNN